MTGRNFPRRRPHGKMLRRALSPIGKSVVATMLIGGLGIALQAHARVRATVTFETDATVTETSVRLGDLAKVETDDAALRENLEALVVGPSPRVGDTWNLRSGSVRLAVRRERLRLGLSDSEMEFAGAEVTRVAVASQEITPQDIIDRVRPWIDERIGVMARADRMELDFASVLRPVVIPTGEWDAAPASTWAPRRVSSTLSVPVLITIDDAAVKRVTLALNLHLYATIPMANRAVHRHEALTEADVEYVEVDLTTLNGGSPIRPFAEVLGVRATREIRTGEILTNQNSETIPMIAKGDQVTIYLEAPRLSIQTVGEALQDGRYGDFIRIKNLRSKQVIQGRVVKERLVQVDLVLPTAAHASPVALAR